MAGKIVKSIMFSALILAMIFASILISCDRRHGLDTSSKKLADVDDIIMSLNPTQVFLPSQDAVDTVTVNIAVLDPEGVGMSGVSVSVTRTPAIGFLVQPDTTSSQGYTTALFIAQPGVFGTVLIKATAGNKSVNKNLYISGPSEYDMHLNYSPPVPKLIDHEADPYEVTVTLVDTTQRGVSGQPVNFSIVNRVGRISFPDTITTPYTDGQGQFIALFYNTQDDEQNNPDSAIIQAVTSSPTDSTFPIVASVVIPLRRVHNTLTLEATPANVIGDGQDSTIIRAFLLDTDGHGMEGETITFSNPGHDGSYQANAITDQNGIAQSVFKPFTGESHLGPTEIIATYRLGTIHQADTTIFVNIMPVRSIAFITVSLQKQNVVADGVDSSAIFITVQDSTGGLIADGTAVFLEHTGTGFLTPTVTQTTDGQAFAAITAPANITSGPRVDSIFVTGYASDSTAISDTVVVTYIPGPISEIAFVAPESTVTLIAGSGMLDTIKVAAVDANGNPVANGTQIKFLKQIVTSSITPSSAPTNDGIATALYLVGSETGDDNVRAYVPISSTDTLWSAQPVVFRCLSAEATTLVLSASQDNIEVGGASCQVIATLEDAFGNPLSEGYVVAFEIVSANGSSSAPYEWPSFDTEWGVYHDTIGTNINGQAVLQIYSGVVAGPVSIRACTIPLPPDSLFVCDQKSLITISSGPPAFLDVSPTSVGEASNPNNPERYVQVGAGVWDIYTNPVEYGTAVYFSLIPNNIAEIEGNSFTGGAKPYHQDSVQGWAFTRILYGCYSTFDTIRVVAASAGQNGPVADTSEAFALPAFSPGIFLSANPGNLWCSNNLCSSMDTSQITALLTDGGGCAIEFGKIHFSALVAGSIIGPSEDITDPTGIAETLYRIRGCEIPTQQDGIPRVEAAVRATLFGYPDVEAVVDIVSSRPQ